MEPCQKRAKQNSKQTSKSPKALYKQANKLIKQHKCGNSTDAEAQQALEACIASLQQGTHATHTASHSNSSSSSTPLTHGYDLDVDDPQYLLAAAHCTLGQLLAKQGRLQQAAHHLEAALELFPGYVAARLALADALLQQATSQQQLQQVEQLLTAAVASAQQLSEVDKGLLLDANAVCRAEAAAGEVARGRLALLLCQQGRGPEADEHLVALGLCYRLSDEVLQYPVPASSAAAVSQPSPLTPLEELPADAGDDPPAHKQRPSANPIQGKSAGGLIAAVDNALPPALLEHMQRGFAPQAPFWAEHNYGRVGYFSYMWNLQEAPRNSWQQLALHVQAVARQYFPAVAEARYAELWAHCRRHPSGHQLHFDSDDEGNGGVRNPIISTVLYLAAEAPPTAASADDVRGCHGLAAAQPAQAPAAAAAVAAGGTGDVQQEELQEAAAGAVQTCVGGPTLMTDQLLGGPLATHGWLAFPATNRLTMFDARYLHGVLPGRGPSPHADGRRITVMIAFWRDVSCRPAEDGQPGPTMPLPPDQCNLLWPRCFEAGAEGWGSCSPKPAQVVSVSSVWQPLLPGGQPGAATYDRCFQGF